MHGGRRSIFLQLIWNSVWCCWVLLLRKQKSICENCPVRCHEMWTGFMQRCRSKIFRIHMGSLLKEFQQNSFWCEKWYPNFRKLFLWLSVTTNKLLKYWPLSPAEIQFRGPIPLIYATVDIFCRVYDILFSLRWQILSGINEPTGFVLHWLWMEISFCDMIRFDGQQGLQTCVPKQEQFESQFWSNLVHPLPVQCCPVSPEQPVVSFRMVTSVHAGEFPKW